MERNFEELSYYITKLENMISEPTISSEETKHIMIELLYKIQSIPLGINERKMVEDMSSKLISLGIISKNESLYKIIVDRLSFSYFPGISKSKISTLIEKSSDVQLTQAEINSKVTSEEPPGSLTEMEMFDIISHSVANGCQMLCTIQRRRNAIWSSYRMHFEEINLDNNSIQTKMPREYQLLKPSLLLGARRSKSGLSVQWSIWCNSNSQEWKEKNVCAKISRTNNAYYGNLLLADKNSTESTVGSSSASNGNSGELNASGSGGVTVSGGPGGDHHTIIVHAGSFGNNKLIESLAVATKCSLSLPMIASPATPATTPGTPGTPGTSVVQPVQDGNINGQEVVSGDDNSLNTHIKGSTHVYSLDDRANINNSENVDDTNKAKDSKQYKESSPEPQLQLTSSESIDDISTTCGSSSTSNEQLIKIFQEIVQVNNCV